jgi:hypothetical protein
MGLAAVVWGAISLDTGTGEAVFLLGEKCRSAAPDVRSAAPLDFAGPDRRRRLGGDRTAAMAQNDSRRRISVTFDEP